MAETTPINIQIDQEALRAQIKQVIREEVQELAMALWRASYALDPEGHAKRDAEFEVHLRSKWEAEHEPKGDEQ